MKKRQKKQKDYTINNLKKELGEKYQIEIAEATNQQKLVVPKYCSFDSLYVVELPEKYQKDKDMYSGYVAITKTNSDWGLHCFLVECWREAESICYPSVSKMKCTFTEPIRVTGVEAVFFTCGVFMFSNS